MTSTDFAAWWGCALATLVLVWDIYKYKKQRAVLIVNGNVHSGRGTWVSVTVTNIGTAPTTLVGVYIYATPNQRLLEARKHGEYVPSGQAHHHLNQEDRFKLPLRLDPGGVWHGEISTKSIEHAENVDELTVTAVDAQHNKVREKIQTPWHMSRASAA